jgi:amylovoran biosynthesis glycosyltransferase AmsD
MKKKLALFISDLSRLGGIQRVVGNLAASLAGEFEIIVVSCESLPAEPAFHMPGVVYLSLDYRRRWNGWIAKITSMVAMGRRFRSFCRNQQVNVVLSIWFDLNIACAWSLIGTGVTSIGCEHTGYGGASRMWELLRRTSYRLLSAVVCLTETDVGKYKRLNDHSFVIPNFVPSVESSGGGQREKHLLAVGHLYSRKALDRLLWDLVEPLLRHPDWTLVVVGGGEMGEAEPGYIIYLSALISALGIGSQVRIYPATPDVETYFKKASIYVMSSREEGLPMVLLEAKRAGLPIVAYDSPTGPKQIIKHGEDGFLVQDRSGQFPVFVEQLITDESLRTTMGRSGRADVMRRYSEQAVVRMWTFLIDGLATGRPAKAIEQGLREIIEPPSSVGA